MYITHQSYQVSTHSTDDVNDAHSKPANGPLYLDADIELHRHEQDDVDDSQVHEHGREEAPELLRVRLKRVWNSITVCLFTNQKFIETTYRSKAVHLQMQQLDIRRHDVIVYLDTASNHPPLTWSSVCTINSESLHLVISSKVCVL